MLAVLPVVPQGRVVERQRRNNTGELAVYCLHCPRTQVWKSGEEMDGENVKQGDISLGMVSKNGKECDLPDERGEPWARVEEAGECLEPLHRPDDKAAEEMVSTSG